MAHTWFNRWLYFILGGALFAPYAIFAVFAVPLASPSSLANLDPRLTVSAGLVIVLVLIALTSRVSFVHTLESASVPALLGGHATGLVVPTARTREAKVRHCLAYLAHTVVGAIISVASVITPPVSILLLVGAFGADDQIGTRLGDWTVARGWAIPLAVVLPLVVVLVTGYAGRLAADFAPVLLGPDPAARLEELERRTAELTERNRLARELHDSIGHVLTVTTLQATAARTVLDKDPAFVAQALKAIEDTNRSAAADLDAFLRLLREETGARAPQPTLLDLAALVASHREAGLPVQLQVDGELSTIAGTVSREVYRIVQEGLTNVQRHAGTVPTTVRVSVSGSELVAEVSNEPGTATRTRSAGGGRGLVGVRDRVRLLGGRLCAGPTADNGWRLDVTVPSGVSR